MMRKSNWKLGALSAVLLISLTGCGTAKEAGTANANETATKTAAKSNYPVKLSLSWLLTVREAVWTKQRD